MKHFCSFSEAIRAGIPLRPQAFEDPSVRERRNDACVIESGLEAIRGRYRVANSESSYRFLRVAFPYLETVAPCPACNIVGYECARQLLSMLWHLNDWHRWTREQIADWLHEREEAIGFVTLIESESSSKSLQRADVNA